MTSTSHVVQYAFKPIPVIHDGSIILAAFHHFARQAIGKLQLNGLAVSVMAFASLLRP